MVWNYEAFGRMVHLKDTAKSAARARGAEGRACGNIRPTTNFAAELHKL